MAAAPFFHYHPYTYRHFKMSCAQLKIHIAAKEADLALYREAQVCLTH
jgi:hypothetical protein